MSVYDNELRRLLCDEHVQQLAARFGVPVDKVLELLSDHLPQTVDQASPNGKLETDENGSD